MHSLSDKCQDNIVRYFLLTFVAGCAIIIKLSDESLRGKTAGAAQEGEGEGSEYHEKVF